MKYKVCYKTPSTCSSSLCVPSSYLLGGNLFIICICFMALCWAFVFVRMLCSKGRTRLPNAFQLHNCTLAMHPATIVQRMKRNAHMHTRERLHKHAAGWKCGTPEGNKVQSHGSYQRRHCMHTALTRVALLRATRTTCAMTPLVCTNEQNITNNKMLSRHATEIMHDRGVEFQSGLFQ